MKKNIVVLLIGILMSGVCMAGNYALHLDGQDNNVRTGIGFLSAPWTLEAWIKGDDNAWKDTEIIFGGGEYSQFNWADCYPLVLKKGRLYTTCAHFGSPRTMDSSWHHVALTCDGRRMTLYLDGNVEASRDTAVTVIPGTLGASNEKDNIFGGLMDEVRVWSTALSQKEIKEWMYRPIDATHPKLNKNMAYYNFDAGFSDDEMINWRGSGYHSYHLRNTRMDYAGQGAPAYTVPNDNPCFQDYAGEQRLFNVWSLGSEWSVDCGSRENQVMKLRIITQGALRPLRLEEIQLDLSGTTKLSDITALHVYAVGQTPRSRQRTLLASLVPKKKIRVRLPADKQIALSPGTNYILVTADVADDAHCGDCICVVGHSVKLSGKNVRAEKHQSYIQPVVTDYGKSNPKAFRVVQWNIWHSGRHLPSKGRQRIIELLRATRADIITMQEAYGFQEELADSLHCNMCTPHAEDNLALYSPYPLARQQSSSTFCSNPVVVSWHDRSILVNDCWTHYSTNPDYTSIFPNRNQDVRVWERADSLAVLPDAVRMVEQDTEPLLRNNSMPVIFGGDFNSCSHLDWTRRAADYHQGYGPVRFPVSMYLYEKGYRDAFREAHPDEGKRPEGSFAGIYGQLDFSRIDFIYYLGHLKVLSSQVIQTMPEIDDVWPSDHSAVVATFEWQ